MYDKHYNLSRELGNPPDDIPDMEDICCDEHLYHETWGGSCYCPHCIKALQKYEEDQAKREQRYIESLG